mmetsp:Transcript_18438/g.53853  ORF Transcript_18438/g.53853 Transcript_18438/m.53853 type:complete len:229 (-) Transcript_18438:379-1065(-)
MPREPQRVRSRTSAGRRRRSVRTSACNSRARPTKGAGMVGGSAAGRGLSSIRSPAGSSAMGQSSCASASGSSTNLADSAARKSAPAEKRGDAEEAMAPLARSKASRTLCPWKREKRNCRAKSAASSSSTLCSEAMATTCLHPARTKAWPASSEWQAPSTTTPTPARPSDSCATWATAASASTAPAASGPSTRERSSALSRSMDTRSQTPDASSRLRCSCDAPPPGGGR